MLRRRAETPDEETHEQPREPPGQAGGDETEGRDRGARGEKPRLAPSLGKEAGGNLAARHPAAVGGLEQADLGEVQTELRAPDGQEHVDDVGEAVVNEMGRA